MSTRCNVYVKLREEDKGTTNKSLKFGNPVYISDDTNYIGIYCHHDGYPEGVGEVLKTNYNTYEKALELVLNGDTSSIGADLDHCGFYAEREEWKYNQPDQSKSYPTINEEYLYVFVDGNWEMSSIYEE